MSFRFPDNKEAFVSTPWTNNGVKWIYNPERQRWARYDDLQRATFVQDAEPTGTKAGQFWYAPTAGTLYVYDGSVWQEAGGGGGASVVVDSTAPVDPETGTVWLDTTDDTLKVYDSTGWLPINTWNALTGTVDEIPFTILQPNGDLAKGVLAWDGTEETLSLGVANDSVLQIGQETLYHVQNASTTTAIANGTPVMYAGTVGASGKLYVAPWDGNVANVKKFMGIATCPIPARTSDANTGYVTHFGKVRGINTTGTPVGETWVSGQILYLKKGAGGLTNVAPTAPGPRTIVALVVNAHTNGTLFVRITHGSNLGDDELVQLSTLADRHALLYDSTDGRFENRAIVSADVSDATPFPYDSKIVLRGALGDAAFGEQISVQGTSNKITISPLGFSFSNETNTNLLGVEFPLLPAANRTITFPDASGTVSLEGHTHAIGDLTGVELSAPVLDGQVLFYDESISKFVNREVASGNISDATDENVAETVVLRGAGGAVSLGPVSIFTTGGFKTTLSSTSTTDTTAEFPTASGTLALTSRTDGKVAQADTHDLTTASSPTFAGGSITGATSLGGAVTSSVSGSLTNVLQWNFTSGTYSYYLRGDGVFQASSFLVSGLFASLTFNGLKIKSNLPVAWSNGDAVTGASDTFLYRDAANTLALRSATTGTVPQTLNVYGVYNSATSYERIATKAVSGSNFVITTEKGSGGGTARGLDFQTDSVTRLTLAATGAASFTNNVSATGDIEALGGAGEIDNTSLYGSSLKFRSAEALVSTTSGTTATATNLIPAGALVLGVVVRVVTAITGAASFDVGVSTETNKWGDTINIALNTTTTSGNFNDGSPLFCQTATNVVLTANGSDFTAGAVRVCVHYIQISNLTA